MPPRAPLALILALAIATTGCATIVSGKKQTVRIESHPPGASVKVDGQSAKTPCDLRLSRKHTYDVTIEKPGYVPSRRHLAHETNPAFWGNALLGGLIGMIVDMSTGAYYQLEPPSIYATLIEDPSNSAETTGPAEAPAPRPPRPHPER